MIKAVAHTQQYFQAPKNYFWHWAEEGLVIEWIDGLTICYRDALIAIMNDLSLKGFPPLGSILLVLSACDKKRIVDEDALLNGIIGKFNASSLNYAYETAKIFFSIIHALPEELKSGKSKIHLLQEVFNESDFILTGNQAKEALNELNSGHIDKLIFADGEEITKEQILVDLKYICDALQRFPTAEKLELRLRTGLASVPHPAELELPDSAPMDLFDELLQDPKTIGIARLAKRLVAALNVPMHSTLAGDQSYGGITDITNRGSYDKLLLSELAHDNDLLMARLVNNEALYFRREEPPDNPKRQRTILVDTTIKMWGVPRAFAISAALAFAQGTRHKEIVEAYALRGDSYNEIKLDTKAGIVNSLEALDHALHCGRALQRITNDMAGTDYNELIFITGEKTFSNPAFYSFFSEIREALGFLLTVNRDGDIHFYECKRGKTKLLSTAKFDLEELLFAPIKFPGKTKDHSAADLPAFLLQTPAPLLFPKMRIKLTKDRLFHIGEPGVLVINKTQRVLLMPHKEIGAYELLNYIEKGSYTLGFTYPNALYVVVNNYQRKMVKIYFFDLIAEAYDSINLSDEIQFVTAIGFHDDKFYFRTGHAEFLFDCKSKQVINKQPYGGFSEIRFAPQVLGDDDFSKINEYIEPFDSIMYKIKELYITSDGKLVLGNYTLALVWNDHNIRVIENVTRPIGEYLKADEDSLVHSLVQNKGVKFKIWKWDDGSQAIVDSRGFLHLRSSDASIPEFSLVLVTGRNTACWSSDGVVSGDRYFLDQNKKVVPVKDFYERYIQRFINRVMRS